MSAFSSQPGSEYTVAFAITPDVAHEKFRALYVGGAGDVRMIAEGSTAAGFLFNFTVPLYQIESEVSMFTGAKVGSVLEVRGAHVLSGTTATNLVGLA